MKRVSLKGMQNGIVKIIQANNILKIKQTRKRNKFFF